MQIPLQIGFHNLAPSEALADLVREEVAKLEDHYPRLVGCKVAVEEPNRHHRHGKGRRFRVRIELLVPGEQLVAAGEADETVAGGDAYAAVALAFSSARRELQDFARRHGWRQPHQRRERRSRPWLAS